MKKEWILSDVEKQQKRAKIEENRAKKRLDPTDSGASMQAESSSLLLPPASPAESIASTASERPQAIVLPSARLQGAEEGPSRTKVIDCVASKD